MMGEKTPYEVWTGRKPHLGHLKVFGCLAHVKVATPHLKKLDDRSTKMVYLGAEERSKAHRLLDTLKQKIVVSRDVAFEEIVQWTWTAQDAEVELAEFGVEGGDFFTSSFALWENSGVRGSQTQFSMPAAGDTEVEGEPAGEHAEPVTPISASALTTSSEQADVQSSSEYLKDIEI